MVVLLLVWVFSVFSDQKHGGFDGIFKGFFKDFTKFYLALFSPNSVSALWGSYGSFFLMVVLLVGW